ncbi:conserved hypothetical protein [Vibrio owensii]|uniref:Uncharacterized protein n=1 Tax=Vibrio owensii TaxID=696485 RepID=A0AAU9Q0N9_9VIBR|nr:conserved hypothetical protein [Vibrio owensii]
MGIYDDPKNSSSDSSESPPDKKQDFEAYYKFLRAKDPRLLPVMTEVNPFRLARERYIDIAIRELYSRILYATLEIVAIPEKIEKSDFSKTVYDTHTPEMIRGLMHYIIEAMANEEKLVLRKHPIQGTTNAYWFEERTHFVGAHKDDDANQHDFVHLDFEEFYRTELLEEYYGMIFDAIVGTAKLIRVGGAVVFKVAGLSDLISDKEVLLAVETQIKQVNSALEQSRAGYIDSESEIELPEVNMEPADKQMKFGFSLVCNATGRPMSFVNGEIAASLGSTGEGDRKQNRQASVRDFHEILKGVLDSVFSADFDIKPDFEQLDEVGNFMNSLEMSTLISEKEKRHALQVVVPWILLDGEEPIGGD